jgi:hypothetical protein
MTNLPIIEDCKSRIFTYTLQFKEGKPESMTGDFYSLDNTKMKQLLTKEQAFDL